MSRLPLHFHAPGRASGVSSLSDALPADLVTLTWSGPPADVGRDGAVWTRWPIALRLQTALVSLHFDLLITEGVDRWRQGWYRCSASLEASDVALARFQTWGDAYGTTGASFASETPSPAVAHVLTALLARPHPAVRATWDGLETRDGFAWMAPILESEVLRVDGQPLDPCLDL